MEKISIIIPVYNEPIYIKRCLNSLINQTYKNIEIICINDGSTDNTLEVLNDYTKQDKRIIIINQENQKLGAARNNGLDKSTGNFITYIDSDDWISSDYIEKMYNAIISTNSDMAISSARRIKPNGKYRNYMHYDKMETVTGIKNILEVIKMPPYNEVWGKLYKKEIIKDIKFEEGIFYEDIYYSVQVVNRLRKIVTVPYVIYYYFNNNKSIMKSKKDKITTQNKIDSMINYYDYIEEHNIPTKEFVIEKEKHVLYTIKHYRHKKEFYLLGIKFLTINKEYNREKNFLVFNTACFGDVLLCNTLVQNIKNIYPKSKVIFICDKKFVDVAKYQLGVDDVVYYDKRGEHKGLTGLIKFLKEFPYKNIFASFITYKNYRNFLISKILKSKFIFNGSTGNLQTQLKHANMVKNITHKKIINYPIKYLPPQSQYDFINSLDFDNNKYVVLNPVSKKTEKDMSIDLVEKIIQSLNTKGFNVILTGNCKKMKDYTNTLIQNNISFTNAVNKTTIIELANLLQKLHGLISVDTGTMHLGYALNVPTLAIFYQKDMVAIWGPDKSIYNIEIIDSNINAGSIVQKFEILVEKD